MLDLPEIQTGDYEETLYLLLREAEKAAENGGSWKNFSEGSPFIAITELLTFVALKQRENMNIISGRVLQKLAVLMGEAQHKTQPAYCLAAFDGGDETLPEGERVDVESLPFELAENLKMLDNRVVSVGEMSGHSVAEYNYNDVGTALKLFTASDNVVFGLQKPLKKDETAALTLCFDPQGKKELQRLSEENGFVVGTKVVWQYYGAESGKTGWHDVKLLSDETLACLRTGTVKFTIRGEHNEKQSVYPVRCVVLNNSFDVLPVLTGAYMNAAVLRQTETLCESRDFSAEQYRKNKMYFDGAMADSGCKELLILTENGYVNARSFGVDFASRDKSGRTRLVTSLREKITSEIMKTVAESENKAVMRLIMYKQSFVKDFLTFSADGSANFSFEINFSGICPENMRLMVLENDVWHEWLYVPDLMKTGADDEVFSETDGKIVFGDNMHGAVPPRGNSNIMIIDLRLSSGALGNIPAGGAAVTRIPEIKAKRITISEGGTDEESAEDFFARALRKKRRGTLLTEEDFNGCALETPGLLLKSAHAFYDGSGVVIMIEPNIDDKENISERLAYYPETVYNYVKPYKPLGLNLSVRFPVYINIRLTAEAESDRDSEELEAAVMASASEYFGNLYGTDVEFAALFRKIASLDGIASLRSLTINSDSRLIKPKKDGGFEYPKYGRIIVSECAMEIKHNYEDWS